MNTNFISSSAQVFRHSVLFLAMMHALPLLANPSGATVVQGSATVGSSGNTTIINQTTDRAIINWQNFSIGANELTRFDQPSPAAAILNRVISGNPSSILGTLESNGQVFLINPNGILVGPNGVINTGGFLGSTFNVDDASFMNGGTMAFNRGSSIGEIQNLGVIEGTNGNVNLFAFKINNEGLVGAQFGKIGLATGDMVVYNPQGVNRLLVMANNATTGASISSTGAVVAAQVELKAAGGDPTALAVNVAGAITAQGFDVSQGQIIISATRGQVDVAGNLVATTQVASDPSMNFQGSDIQITGDGLTVKSGANLQTFAGDGRDGGRIQIGQAEGGLPSEDIAASRITVESGARISADSGAGFGRGGQIDLYSTGNLSMGGALSAKGNSGALRDAGTINLTGEQVLGVTGSVNAVDPANPTVRPPTTNLTLAAKNIQVSSQSGFIIPGFSDLSDDKINELLQTNNVTINAIAVDESAGNIEIMPFRDTSRGYGFSQPNTGGNHSLTFNAAKDFTLLSSLVASDDVTFRAGRKLSILDLGIAPQGSLLSTLGVLTLVSDTASSGAVDGGISFTPKFAVRGQQVRLFAPTLDSVVLNNNSVRRTGETQDLVLPVVQGKSFGDSDTDGSAIYLSGASSGGGSSGGGSSPGDGNNSNTVIGIVVNPGLLPAVGGQLIVVDETVPFGVDPSIYNNLVGYMNIEDVPGVDQRAFRLREELAYWQEILRTRNDLTPAFRKELEEHIVYLNNEIRPYTLAEENAAKARQAKIYEQARAFSVVPGPQEEINRLQGEINALTDEILKRQLELRKGSAFADMLTLGIGGLVVDAVGDKVLKDLQEKLQSLSAQKAAIDGSVQKAALASTMVARAIDILSTNPPYSAEDQALLNEIAQRAQSKLVEVAELQLNLYNDFQNKSYQQRVNDRQFTNLYTLFDVGDPVPDFAMLANQQAGLGIGASSAAGVAMYAAGALTGSGVSAANVVAPGAASRVMQKVRPYLSQQVQSALRRSAEIGQELAFNELDDAAKKLADVDPNTKWTPARPKAAQNADEAKALVKLKTSSSDDLAKAISNLDKAADAVKAAQKVKTAVETSDAVRKAATKVATKFGFVADVVLSVATATASYAGEVANANSQGEKLEQSLKDAQTKPYDLVDALSSEESRMGLINLLAASFKPQTGGGLNLVLPLNFTSAAQ